MMSALRLSLLLLVILYRSLAVINEPVEEVQPVEGLKEADNIKDKPASRHLQWRPKDMRSLRQLERTMGYSEREFEELKVKVPKLKKMMADFYKIKRFRLSCVPSTKKKCELSSNFQPRDLTFGDITPTSAQVDTLINTFSELLASRKTKRRKKRQMFRFDNFPSLKWNQPINYMINNDYGNNQTWAEERIMAAINHWEENTCLIFQRRDISEMSALENEHYLVFANFFGCYSKLGQAETGGQVIALGIESCYPFEGVAIHELGHALGLFHQQNRIDSSTYLDILQDNILSSALIQFLPWETPSQIRDHNVQFDVGSIMQYGAYHFAIDPLKRTIETDDPLMQYNLGQRNHLSFYDRKLVIKEYCDSECSGSPLSCERSGIQNPIDCGSCICPDGFGGIHCDTVDTDSHQNCVPLTNSPITVSSTEQCLQTPGYLSGGYTPGDRCNWFLQAPTGRKIKIYFTGSLDLYEEPATGSCWHWAEIKYKGNLDTVGARFCNSSKAPGPLVSEYNEVMVTFRSDYNKTDMDQQQGFQLCYILEEETNVTTTEPSTTSTTATTQAPPTCPNHELRCADFFNNWKVTTQPWTKKSKRKRLIIGPGAECTDKKFKTTDNDTTVYIRLPEYTTFTLHSLCVKTSGATNDTEVRFGLSAGGIPLVYYFGTDNCLVLGGQLPTGDAMNIVFTRDQTYSHLKIHGLFLEACY